MQPRVGEGFVELLESIASRFYPGLFAVIDESVEELLGKSGLRAHLVVGHSPAMEPKDVAAVVMVSPAPLGPRALPQQWREILDSCRKKSIRVDLFVHKGDGARVQKLAREINPRTLVVSLPQDLRRLPTGRRIPDIGTTAW